MKPFTKIELLNLGIIFVILIILSVPNFILSIKRSRDVTRKNDLGEIMNVLDVYLDRYREFPASSDGKIVACAEGNIDQYTVFTSCEWGGPSPFGTLPSDPQKNMGASYIYLSNGKHYQVLGALEVTGDDEFREDVVKRNIGCGTRQCNFGRGYSNTPLDISLEEYENELLEK